MTVTCARCGHDWDEGDPGVRYADGDSWCNWEGECDDRIDDRPITVVWRAAIAADPNPERLRGAHDGVQ
jgi:hypothetical protein